MYEYCLLVIHIFILNFHSKTAASYKFTLVIIMLSTFSDNFYYLMCRKLYHKMNHLYFYSLEHPNIASYYKKVTYWNVIVFAIWVQSILSE